MEMENWILKNFKSLSNQRKNRENEMLLLLSPPFSKVYLGIYFADSPLIGLNKAKRDHQPLSDIWLWLWQIVKPKSQVQSPKVKAKGLGMTIKSHGPPTPPHSRLLISHPQFLSMKECSGKKPQKIKVAQNYPLDSSSQKNLPGGQREQGHGVVLHVQEEVHQWKSANSKNGS